MNTQSSKERISRDTCSQNNDSIKGRTAEAVLLYFFVFALRICISTTIWSSLMASLYMRSIRSSSIKRTPVRKKSGVTCTPNYVSFPTCALLTPMERKKYPARRRMSTGQIRMCCCHGYHRTGIRFNVTSKHPLSPDSVATLKLEWPSSG